MIHPDTPLAEAREMLDWLENQHETEVTKTMKEGYIKYIQQKVESDKKAVVITSH